MLKLKVVFCCIFFMIFTISCNKDFDEVQLNLELDNEKKEIYLDFLSSLGFAQKDIVVSYENSEFIIEKDIKIKFEDVEYWLSNYNTSEKATKDSNTRIKHQRHHILLSPDKVKYITFYIEDDVPQLWREATVLAANRWIGIKSSTVRFIHVSSLSYNPDIVIKYSENKIDWAVAWAYLPHRTNEPGSVITISPGYYDVDDGANPKAFYDAIRCNTLVHEFGHAIGFHHTMENDGSTKGTYIPGTPHPDTDYNGTVKSVMNWGGVHGSGFSFSEGDIKAVSTLYPFYPEINNNSIISFPDGSTIYGILVDKKVAVDIYWDKNKIKNRYGTIDSDVELDLFQFYEFREHIATTNNDGHHKFYLAKRQIYSTYPLNETGLQIKIQPYDKSSNIWDYTKQFKVTSEIDDDDD